MATITAEAKIYNGFRLLCVDKNISANLTNTIVQTSNVRRVRRTAAGLEGISTLSLVDERYATYGGGNNVLVGGNVLGSFTHTLYDFSTTKRRLAGIPRQTNANISNPYYRAPVMDITITREGNTQTLLAETIYRGAYISVGDVFDFKSFGSPILTITVQTTTRGTIVQSGGWTTTSSLSCKFPTYMRFDIEALGVPEGIDIILQMEEGFVIEGDYPNSEGKPLPKVTNLMTFRTPYKGAVYPSASFTLVNPGERRRPFEIDIDALFSPSFTVVAKRLGLADMDVSSQVTAGLTYANALFKSDMVFYVDGGSTVWNPSVPGFNYRVRYFDSTFDTAFFTMPDIPDGRVRLGVSDFNNEVIMTSDVDRLIGDVDVGNISANFEMSINADRLTGIQSNMLLETSTSLTPTITLGLIQNIQSQFSLSGEGSIAMVIEHIGASIQLPILYGSVDCEIDWGDGTSTILTSTNGSFISHSYTAPGYGLGVRKQIKISGYVQHFGYASTSNVPDWALNSTNAAGLFWGYNSVKQIVSFGDLGTETFVAAFTNLRSCSDGIPTRLPSTITDISGMFWHTVADDQLQDFSNVSGWDVSNVTKMEKTFFRCRNGFNPDIGGWDVSNVTSMIGMFYFADSPAFNPDLSQWCVSNIPSEPTIFTNVSTTQWPLSRRPVWGTCP